MSREGGVLSAEEARALWERAMELQLEAARRKEGQEESRAMVVRDDPGTGFRLEDVTEAAREAGISPEYMEMALAEQEVTRKRQDWKNGKGGAAARRLLAPRDTSIQVSRVIRREPGEVLAAMQRILPHNPYGLVLEDTRGDDPLNGGTLIFKAPSMQTYAYGNTFSMEMAWGTVTHLLVSLWPVAGEEDSPSSTEVVIRAPLVEHDRQSYWLGLGMTGTLGIIGGGGGLAAGLALAGAAALGPLALAAVAVPSLLGAGGGGALGVWGSRGTHRYGIRKSREALESLLQVLDANTRTRGSFPVPRPTGAPGSGTGPGSGDFGGLGDFGGGED